MPTLSAKHHASELQRQLRSLLGHDQIVTQAYAAHLLIKRLDDQDPIVVARLARLGRSHYAAALRAPRGHWGPTPRPTPRAYTAPSGCSRRTRSSPPASY